MWHFSPVTVLRIICDLTSPYFPLGSDPLLFKSFPTAYQRSSFFSAAQRSCSLTVIHSWHRFYSIILPPLLSRTFFRSYLKSYFLCSCPTSASSVKQWQPLKSPGSCWANISYLPVLHAPARCTQMRVFWISLQNISAKYFIFQLNISLWKSILLHFPKSNAAEFNRIGSTEKSILSDLWIIQTKYALQQQQSDVPFAFRQNLWCHFVQKSHK